MKKYYEKKVGVVLRKKGGPHHFLFIIGETNDQYILQYPYQENEIMADKEVVDTKGRRIAGRDLDNTMKAIDNERVKKKGKKSFRCYTGSHYPEEFGRATYSADVTKDIVAFRCTECGKRLKQGLIVSKQDE